VSIIIYTKYLQENAIFLQACIIKRFTNIVDINIYLKEQLYIVKYLEYLSFFYSNVLDFEESEEYKKIMSYYYLLFNKNTDNQFYHNETKTTDTKRNIRQLVDNVITEKYFKTK